MKIFLSIILISITYSCVNQNVRDHPFDDDFKFSIVDHTKELDTIYHTCGYYSIIENHDEYEIYYDGLFQADEFLAKGLQIYVDSMPNYFFTDYESNMNILNQSSLDTIKINEILNLLGFHRVAGNGKSSLMYGNDTYQIEFLTHNLFNSSVQRYLATRSVNSKYKNY